MPRPRARYWKAIVQRDWGDGPEPGRWRDADVDPPPSPPTEVFWLRGIANHKAL